MRLVSDEILIDRGVQTPVNDAVYPMLDEFQLWNPAAWTGGQPYEFYAKMRETAPVMWSPMGREASGFWSVSRYDDIKQVELAPDVFSSQRGSINIAIGPREKWKPEKLVPAGGLSGADIDVGYGVEGVVLEACAVDSVAQQQTDLTQEQTDGSSLEELIDRLSNRLGAGRVVQLTERASHLPERAQGSVPAVSARDITVEDSVPPLVMYGDAPLRPIRMLTPPEPVEVVAEVPEGPPRQFRWRRMLHAVAKAEGPERLAPEWWLAADRGSITRDYYRVEDEAGRRFWIYRDGLYERETTAPRWFMHGVFA